MEGPTPVSALIHAATMVTAGVFLLTRCSFLFENSPIALTLVIFIGSMTAIFAATTGLFQNDMKKVIAYSTCSQLGYMVFACGLSSYDVGMFHLSNHAFFKALLFLGAGSVIHAMGDEQDMRKMGGLNQLLPFSYASALIGSFALIGFPFLAGYYSKDIILEVAATTFTNIGQFAYWLGVGAAFCTAFYSTRLILLVYLVNTNANKAVIMHAHEPSWRMSLPLLLLSTLSLFVGYLSKDFFIGLGSDFWNGSIFIAYNNYKIVQSEFLSVGYKIIPFIITILGVSSAYYLYAFNITNYYIARTESSTISWVSFFAKKWYIDRVYNELISQSALSLGLSYFYKDIDRGLIERIGPLGIYDLTYSISDIVKCGNGKTILNLLKMLAFGVSFLLLLPVMIDLNLLFL
jgi:proton-translocating NADH-quinone oxidoreductase chain L